MTGRVFMGRYEVIRLLGEGGMGRVYLARQIDLGRQVVVKVMHDHIAADATFRDRFTRETLLMARFQHPYAVTLYDASLNDPQGSCIVMEYIKGVTLDALMLGGQRLSPPRVSRILRMLCEVLQAAHAQGIVHRDLKPANIMIVDPNTPYELVKVMDFGLAKLLAPDPDHPQGVTHSEFAVGTPGYMCPEQAKGEEMDHRGDIYSVGILLFEMLTGQLPFAGRATMDILLAHVTESPPPFALFGTLDAVPPALEELVMACLAKDPNDRPRSARELSEAFEMALAAETAALQGDTILDPVASSHTGRPRPLSNTPTTPTGSNQPQAVVATVATPTVSGVDPLTTIHHLEAWMPEGIAVYKLAGFVQHSGGMVVENIPGRIRVRLGGRNSIYQPPARGALSWLGLRSTQFDMELRLQRAENGAANQLHIIVLFRAPSAAIHRDRAWHDLCNRIFIDLRGHLMAQNGQPPSRQGQ
jgi:serine/threonine-protein kinase